MYLTRFGLRVPERSEKPLTILKTKTRWCFPLCAIVFLQDKNGTIDYQEFTSGLAQFYRGTLDEKLKMLFKMYVFFAPAVFHPCMYRPHDRFAVSQRTNYL
jgi:hypothetical protein